MTYTPDYPRPGMWRRVQARVADRVPEPIKAEIRDATERLMKVRSVEDAEELITHEVERLLTVVAPMFVNYPMPVNPTTARLVVGVSAGGAALLEEIDAIAAVVSAGATVPSAPILLAADFAALVMEAYVAASVRVRQLDRLGRPVVGEEVARDLAQALTGAGPSSGREATQDMAAGIAKRLIKRWVVGVTPFAGIAYDGWDAQKTVTAILRMPLPELED